MPQKNSYEHIVHFIIFSLAVILFFKIIEPLITILLTSIIITYVSFPLYTRIRKVMANRFASIALTIVIIIIILLLPFSYLVFRDGENITKRIINWLPFRKKTVNKLTNQFKKITYTIVFAQLFVALAQGIVGMAGFYIFGVPLAIFWGVVTAFFALVPTIGTAVIWVPASLFLVLSGYLSQNYIMVAKGAGLFVYGLLVISTIDNLLRIKIIHVKAEVHPIIVISGVIGGISLFGIIGLFVGPILLSMLITYFETFKERFM